MGGGPSPAGIITSVSHRMSGAIFQNCSFGLGLRFRGGVPVPCPQDLGGLIPRVCEPWIRTMDHDVFDDRQMLALLYSVVAVQQENSALCKPCLPALVHEHGTEFLVCWYVAKSTLHVMLKYL